ncbi:RNA polymerase sigma factor [Chitinophaga agrisoli]|uniref:RNA polymerase sigma factor n=1 Tax=Chitinophaga agrisoli TaxID=2607653 RepID=A0A5B2VPI0_9BACT|nr:RNA polymerase sigma factor [Chitinophaga agrisoli]KAA2240182.1 RNA polymerase sigma factor [Chitinophaga agrisoli]
MQNTHSTDISIVAAFKKGSEQAFTELFHNYSSWLYGEALFYCQDKDDAKDLVQEVFANLWEKRASIDASKDIRKFLFISLRNAYINRVHKDKAAQNYVNYQLRQTNEHISPPELPGDKNNEELANKVRKAVEAIKGNAARSAIEMYYLDGESYENIALKTGQPVQSLRNAVARGLSILRKKSKFR